MNDLEAAQGRPTEAGLRSGRRLSEKFSIVGHKDRDGTKISCPSILRPLFEAVCQYPRKANSGEE